MIFFKGDFHHYDYSHLYLTTYFPPIGGDFPGVHFSGMTNSPKSAQGLHNLWENCLHSRYCSSRRNLNFLFGPHRSPHSRSLSDNSFLSTCSPTRFSWHPISPKLASIWIAPEKRGERDWLIKCQVGNRWSFSFSFLNWGATYEIN